jgi:hypothetical protein
MEKIPIYRSHTLTGTNFTSSILAEAGFSTFEEASIKSLMQTKTVIRRVIDSLHCCLLLFAMEEEHRLTVLA